MGVVGEGDGVAVISGVLEGAGVFVGEGLRVSVGNISVEVSVIVGASVTGEGLHPVIHITTINKVETREMCLLSMDLAFRDGLQRVALNQSDVCFPTM